LTLEHETIGLRALHADGNFSRRPHTLTLSKRGEVVHEMRLDEASLAAGFCIEEVPPAAVACEPSRTRRMDRLVVLPAPLECDREVRYSVRHSCSNSVVMTGWEAEERACDDERQGMARRADWDQEGVGCYIRHPIERLELQLRLPPSLAGVRPTLRCERQAEFPDFAVTRWGDAELCPDANFQIDEDMATADGQMLRFDDGIWRMTVFWPVVGCRYRIHWPTPDLRPIEPLVTETQLCRQLLSAMAESPTAADGKARASFQSLAEDLERRVAVGGRRETWRVQLFVYAPGTLALRLVASCSSRASSDACQEFSVGVGDGIVGAAFLRRVIVPWVARGKGAGPFKPVLGENPTGDFQSMLAIPIFHPQEWDKERRSLWGTIGVVCFSSSLPASRVSHLLNDVFLPEAEELANFLRAMAHSHVHEMITALRGIDPSSGERKQGLSIRD